MLFGVCVCKLSISLFIDFILAVSAQLYKIYILSMYVYVVCWCLFCGHVEGCRPLCLSLCLPLCLSGYCPGSFPPCNFSNYFVMPRSSLPTLLAQSMNYTNDLNSQDHLPTKRTRRSKASDPKRTKVWQC